LHKKGIKTCLLWCLLFLVLILSFTTISVAYLQPKQVNALFKISTKDVRMVTSKISPPMRVDSIRHGILGFILGLFTLDPSSVIFSVFTSVFIDLDHVPFFLGLHVPARISHSLIFLSVADISYFLLFRRKETIIVMTSSFLLHMALDGLRVPFFSPILMSPDIPAWLCPVFAVIAFSLNSIFLGKIRWKKIKRI